MKRSFNIRPLSPPLNRTIWAPSPQPDFFLQDDDWAAVVEEEEDRKRVLGVEGQVWRRRRGREMDAIQFWRGNGQEKWAGQRKRIEEEEMSFPSSPNRFFHYIAFERLLFRWGTTMLK